MSRKFGVIPQSGEQILKDALGQFKSIIAQVREGARKVTAKLAENTKQISNLEGENDRLGLVMSEAMLAADNLEAILSKKVVVEDVEKEETPSESTK